MEEAINDTGRFLHILDGLEHLAQGITIFDQDLKLVAWNSRFMDIYGYPSDMAFRGADFGSFIEFNAAKGDYGPGDVAALTAERVRIARQFRAHRIQRTLPDGATIEIVGSPLPNGGFVTTYTDITSDIRQREILRREVSRKARELRLSQERLVLIADEVPAGIAHMDENMNILYANRRFARAYGHEAAGIIGLNAAQVLHPRTLEESARFFEQARRGAQIDFEMRIELPGKRFKDIRTLLRPERPSTGEVIGFYLVSIDVSRRKATASALMQSQKMDALGRMASGISHDFNNVLTVILGNLAPLIERLDDPELTSEFLQPAISAARRGSILTRRLLSLARREQVDPRPTDIAEAVEETCGLISASLPASLKLVRDHAPGLPPAQIDRAQFEMALLNLALNSRDATGGCGTIRIETALHELQPEEADFFHMRAGDYIRIDFADDGCGIPPEMMERIFEPFATSKAPGAGSGLGLSMVYQFARQSNGRIWVESTDGQGTTFTILLPAEETAARFAPAPRAPTIAATPSPKRRLFVLLVEDDLDVRRVVRRMLAGLGHHLVEAANPEEAEQLVAAIKGIDIVLSDIDMPGGLNGLDLARGLLRRRPQIPVVLMSGKRTIPADDQLLARVPFLSKPFTPEALRAALEQAGPRISSAGGAP